MNLQHSEYYNYAKLTSVLKNFAQKYPDFCELTSIGKTQGGFDIWLMTLTANIKNQPGSKPGFWVDGNTHATELAGCQACIHLMDTLLSKSQETQIRDLLENVTFYIVPRISVEGAEAAITSGELYRSSPEIFPMHVPHENFQEKDIDGDGHALMMRVKDPSGAFKVSHDDPRLMVTREPYEFEGEFYHLLPEGEFLNFDGFKKSYVDTKRFDLNRQAPNQFSPSEYGAGPLPMYLNEAKALAQAFVDRPNIVGVTTHHTFGGFLLRPSSMRADSDLPSFDLDIYKIQGKMGEKLTGYKPYSVFHDFRYNPKKTTTGTWDDWHYDHRGVFSWTTEIWSLAQKAGVSFNQPLEYYQNPTPEDLLKMIKWCDQNLSPGQFFKSWTKFKHHQLGDVEIGGWMGLYTLRNPPHQFLAAELEKLTAFTIHQALMSPRVRAEVHSLEKLGSDLYRLKIKTQNSGYLPTNVSEAARNLGVYNSPRAEIKLSSKQVLVQGKTEMSGAHLAGRSVDLPWTSPLWGSSIDNKHEDLFDYIIKGTGDIHWTVDYQMGGKKELRLQLK